MNYSPGPKRSGQYKQKPQYAKLGIEPGLSRSGYGATVLARHISSHEGLQPTSYKVKPKVSRPSARTLALTLFEIYNLKKDNLYNGLIHVLGNKTFLIACYEDIKSNPGANTPGLANETMDRIDLKWFEATAEKVRCGAYNFTPARRILIPKPGKSTKRPLGIANPREKIVQKAIQVVLEIIYEPEFLDVSHGFRPKRGCHTALYELYRKGTHYAWAIEGDIEKCFDTIKHDVLVKLIARRIRDDKTLTLIRKTLKAGYVDPETKMVTKPSLGTPQGSVISPLYSNIVLHQMDRYLTKLAQLYHKGNVRRINPVWRSVNRRTSLRKVEKRTLYQALPSRDPLDPNYRRMMYVRYADDFVILVSGPRTECESTKSRLTAFMHSRLGLKVSPEKTRITSTAKGFHFLGADIRRVRNYSKISKTMRFRGGSVGKKRVNQRLRVLAPIGQLMLKLKTHGFAKANQENVVPTGKNSLSTMDHADILAFYNQKIRGLLNYYSFAGNRSQLNRVVYVLKMSCALTLARKYKLKTARGVFKKFGPKLTDPKSRKNIFELESYRAKHLYNKGEVARVDTVLKRSWWNKLTQFSFDQKCAVCGVSPVEMHHLRRITTLKKRIRKGKTNYDQFAGAFKRKQIPLCKKHHAELHLGKLSEAQMQAVRNYT